MPRPKKTRLVSAYPRVPRFIPQDRPAAGDVFLPIEGLEAIRLSDFEHLDQETAAQIMNISRHTFGRILADARERIAQALITAKALTVEGGTFEYRGRGHRRRRGAGMGRGRGFRS
jgi:predicted DNA-binding protein (UPF0251 family)